MPVSIRRHPSQRPSACVRSGCGIYAGMKARGVLVYRDALARPAPPRAREYPAMSIVDDLIENLVERNAADLTGTFTVTFVDGGVRIRGHLQSTLRDLRKNKDVVRADAPIDAQLRIGEIAIPVPRIP